MTELALAEPTPPSGLALSKHRALRLVVLFLLYLAQGLPLGLFQVAITAWLAQNGASAGAVGGVLAMAMLPWTLKAFYCILVDRYAFLAMGRRRPWIIASQFGIVAGLVSMALVNPAAAAPSLVGAFAFAINAASSLQDVAVDGLAVDVLPPEEMARASGFFFGGQVLGMALAGGLGGYLIAYHGLPAALLTLAAVTAAILAVITLVRERPGERLLPWTRGEALQRSLDLHLGAFGPIMRGLLKVMLERQTLIFLPAMILVGCFAGIFNGLAPTFSVQMAGWEKDVYSGWVSQANLVAGILGIVMFGFMGELWGSRRMLIGAVLGVTAIALTMLALRQYWSSGLVLIGFIFAFKCVNTLQRVSAGAVAMLLSNPAIAATQFTLFMAATNLGSAGASASLGWLDTLGGIPAMFAAMALCGVIAAAFAFAAKVGR